MVAVVTGATGFIGSLVAEKLLKKGYEVRCLVRPTSNLQWLDSKNMDIRKGSLFEKEFLEESLYNADYVFHVAGVTAARTKEDFFRGNLGLTQKVLAATSSVAPNCKRFVHVSSLATVGPAEKLEKPVTEDTLCNPITTYGKSKLAAEEEVVSWNTKMGTSLPVTIVRPPAVYGIRDTAILTFFQTVSKGLAPLIGFDTKYVSLVNGHDLARGIILAGESSQSVGEIYFISSEEFYTWRQITNITADCLGKSSVLTLSLPHGIVRTVAAVSEFFGKFADKPPVLDREKGKDITQQYWICSIAKAKRELGYSQGVSLREGIQETVDWYQHKGWM